MQGVTEILFSFATKKNTRLVQQYNRTYIAIRNWNREVEDFRIDCRVLEGSYLAVSHDNQKNVSDDGRT